ncbi:MAG: AAA family ATPase [Bacteroidales bacterium]
MKENPFPITSYKGPEYFCNREKETAQLREAVLNGRNMMLFSPRRMGKTGLIHHLFHTLKNEKINPIYVDIFGTVDLNSFINKLANAVLAAAAVKKENLVQKAADLFGRLRPQISYNGLTGVPQVSLVLQNDAEKRATMGELFDILERQKNPVLLAIDEFQQISNYPEQQTEQLLRSHIQHLNNTFFIFSGSQRHMLVPMFSDPKRPFYQSSSFLALDKLNVKEYKRFIQGHFEKNRQAIAEEQLAFILHWTESYTFYTQYLCNKVFSKRRTRITSDLISECISEIFAERETIFYNYRNLLSRHQYELLSAVAREGGVDEPTGQSFIKKYELSNASTVRKSLQALVEKEMIYSIPGEEKPVYKAYDVFLARWFQWKEPQK